jgi:predicted amidohydrolase
VVCAGYIEDAPGGPYNSAICVSGDGVLGHHRKVHLPVRDRELYAPGERFAAFDTPIGRLGMMICYDKIFPESARALALDGAETIACLSAWPISRIDPASSLRGWRRFRQFDLFDQARAAENQVGWVSANQTGTFGGLRFLGRAKVVDPEGHVLSRTGIRADMAIASLDPSAMRDRARVPLEHLAERRVEAYHPLSPVLA